MKNKEVYFKNIKSEEFHYFMDQLQAETQQMLTLRQNHLKASDIARFPVLWGIKSIFSSLSYLSAVDTVQNALHSVLKQGHYCIESAMINELTAYNIYMADRYQYDIDERMKIDIIMFLITEGKSYCRLALNECSAIDDSPFHLETYKHLGRGIIQGFKTKSLGEGLLTACMEREKEVVRIRANALRDINVLIWLYLYGCYLSQNTVTHAAKAVVWLFENGYQWFDIEEQPDRDLLNEYFDFELPHVVLGIEGKKIIDIYESNDSYKHLLLKMYPDTPKAVKNSIEVKGTGKF